MAEQTELGRFGVPIETERRIRNAERHKLAHLLENDGAAIVEYLTDPRDAVALIAYLLRLEANRDVQ